MNYRVANIELCLCIACQFYANKAALLPDYTTTVAVRLHDKMENLYFIFRLNDKK